jgi:DNA repair exonuclease SbcCD ATPase subunit
MRDANMLSQELIHYLDRIRHIWTSILGGDEELMYNLDPETVELFEGRAPKTSSADRDFITRAIESRSAFPLLYDDVKRSQLLQNTVAVDGMIPSIKTLAKDSLYLEDCAKAMRILIDPTECHMREAMQCMWRGYGGDYVVLESADELTEYGDTRTGDEEGFQIAYVQLWMFAMRNFHRLTSLVPKSDNKQKVSSSGPDPQCLLEFARLANALGFRSNAITSILNADADREHARSMLTIARPPDRFGYDLESEITGHCQLLERIRATERELDRGPPVWTTTLSNVKVKQRYGRPHNQALKDCAPYFFLYNVCEIPESGKYVTDLFVKRGIALSFFRIPPLPPEAARQGNRMDGVAVDGASQQRIDYDQTHQATSQAQTRRSARDAAQDAALISRLEERERQVAEQQREISHYKVKLSEAQANSERLLAEVQPYRKRIEELETINLDQSRENSQEHLESVEKLRQSQQRVEALERTIADHESAREMQVVQAKQHQDQREMAAELEKCRLMIAEFERRISECKSESDRQASAAESLRQQLATHSQQATTELEALRSIIVQWERGDLRRPEDINAGAMSQGFQERVAELELVSQRQAEDLRNSREVATIKGRTLDMILGKIKETREGVEKMSTAFTGRLQLEPNYEDGDCETIHSDELQLEDLPAAGAQFDEIEDLKKSIAKFIALYSQNNLAHDENARVKILEWQKLVPGERLAIADGTGTGVETETPDLKQMLAVVSRRAGVLEQEGRAVHDLQAELDLARAAAESQRQKAERVEWLEEELVEVKKQLQQEQVVTRDLGESLKTARNATQRDIELTSALKGELDTAKAENEALLQQGKVAIAELTAELNTVKADAETLRKEAERVCGLESELNDLRTALQATGSVQAELEKTRQDLEDLRQVSSSYIKDLKSAKAKVDKRLETSKSQVAGLEKDLEVARQSIKERERELASLKLEIDDEDERIRLLKAQLFETNRLIQLEKEKENLEAEQKEIQAALAEARASSSPDLGELMQREALVDASLSQVEEKVVETGLDVMRYAKYKVRIENSKTGRQTGVDYVLVGDLEKKFEELRDQVVYCFVNDIMTVVELGKYKDFLANRKHLADHGEFFYCGYNPPRKRHRGLDDAGEDLTSTAGPRARELARLRAKSKEPSLSSPFVFGSRQEER